jgi:DNA-binding CsgD family transcriptional regulator
VDDLVMGRSGNHDYEQLLDLVMVALDDRLTEPVPRALTGRLQVALHAPVAMFLDDRPARSGAEPVLVWTHNTSTERANQRFRLLRPTHPLGLVYAAGSREPLRVSDVVDRRTWRRNLNYRLTRDEVDGSTNHLAIPLDGGPGSFRAFLLCRSGRDYAERDLFFARRAQPLLQRLDRHLTELDRLRRAGRTLIRPPEVGVTPRELTVLSQMTTGATAATIGRRLGITGATVTKHQENLYRKLGTHDRLSTVLAAQGIGLLPAGDRTD